MTAKRFKDPNFQLACLDALFVNGKLKRERATILKTRHADPYSFAVNPERLKALKRIPLTQELLDTITDFGPDGGDDIYTYVIPEWRGTQSELNIRSFVDLKLLRNLNRLSVFACVEKGALDLSQLQPLKHLEILETDYFFVSPDCDIEGAIKTLKDRGVEVKIAGKRKGG